MHNYKLCIKKEIMHVIKSGEWLKLLVYIVPTKSTKSIFVNLCLIDYLFVLFVSQQLCWKADFNVREKWQESTLMDHFSKKMLRTI